MNRGRKTSVNSKNIFLMLTTLKFRGLCGCNAEPFCVKTLTFELLIKNFVPTFSDHGYNEPATELSEQ